MDPFETAVTQVIGQLYCGEWPLWIPCTKDIQHEHTDIFPIEGVLQGRNFVRALSSISLFVVPLVVTYFRER